MIIPPFSKLRVSMFSQLSDNEILREKEKTETFYNEFLEKTDEYRNLYDFTRNLSRIEWYLSELFRELADRGLNGGFRLTRIRSRCLTFAECSVKKKRGLKKVNKHKTYRFNYSILFDLTDN